MNTSGITLTNTADNPVTVQGSVTRTSGAAQLGAFYAKGGPGVTWTINNFGTIGSGTATAGVAGMYLGGFASTVSNAIITNETGGVIGGALYAIFGNGPVNILNKAGGLIRANSNAALYLRSNATINNYGTISDALNTAIYLERAATVINRAGATISAGSTGIQVVGNNDVTVVNAGTITSTGTAIAFNPLYAVNRLVESPSAMLVGRVNGGNGTFELAAGSGPGSVAGIGSTITNFRTLQFDTGAQWTVSGTANSTGFGMMSIVGFTQGDTIDLKSFVATSRTFANNVLTLRNSAAVTATLAIQGTFSTSDFNIRADGSGGTYITEGPLPGPTITAGDTVTFLGGGAAVTLDPTITITITDTQSTTLTGATVAIGAGFISGDRLNFTNQGGITGSFSTATGTLTLSGTASLAAYETALESVTYGFSPTNGDPTGGGAGTSRSVSWIVNDGAVVSAAGSSTVTVTHVAPTINTTGTVSYSNDGRPPVALAPSVTLADPDSGGTLAGATVSITDFAAGDTLSFTNQNGIAGSYNSATGVLTLTGTASLAAYQTALQSVGYSFTPGNDPTVGAAHRYSRNVSWVVRDGSSTNGSSAAATTAINEVPVAPTITAGGTVGYTWSRSPIALNPSLVVSDPDSGGQLAGASIAITGNYMPDDRLNFINQNGITGSYNGGTLVLAVAASLANYQAALASVTFSSLAGTQAAGGVGLNRTITWSVNDGQLNSVVANSTVTVAAPGPIIDVTGTTSFTGGGVPIALAGSLVVTDPNSAFLASATVAITDKVAGDTLGFTNQNGITGSYNPATGVLTLSGTASVASYQTALASVTYGFTQGGDPTTAGTDLARTIAWAVDDGTSTSQVDNSDLTVIHASPSIAVSGNPSFTGGGNPVTLAGTLSLADPDSGGLLNSGTVAISGFVAGDVLTANTSSITISASYNSATGVLALTGADSIAAYEAGAPQRPVRHQRHRCRPDRRWLTYHAADPVEGRRRQRPERPEQHRHHHPDRGPCAAEHHRDGQRRLHRRQRAGCRGLQHRAERSGQRRQPDRRHDQHLRLHHRRPARFHQPKRYQWQLQCRHRRAHADRHRVCRRLPGGAAIDYLRLHRRRRPDRGGGAPVALAELDRDGRQHERRCQQCRHDDHH